MTHNQPTSCRQDYLYEVANTSRPTPKVITSCGQTITSHWCHISENRHRPSEVSYHMTTNFKNFFCSKIWTVSPTISGPVFRSISSLNEKLIALLTITNYQGSHLGMPARIYALLLPMNGRCRTPQLLTNPSESFVFV